MPALNHGEEREEDITLNGSWISTNENCIGEGRKQGRKDVRKFKTYEAEEEEDRQRKQGPDLIDLQRINR